MILIVAIVLMLFIYIILTDDSVRDDCSVVQMKCVVKRAIVELISFLAIRNTSVLRWLGGFDLHYCSP
jgi:hypothetical protein